MLSSKCGIGIAVLASVLRSRWLSVLAPSKPSFSSSRKQAAFSSGSAKVGLLPRCAVQSWHCSTGTAARSVQVRRTRALRADVLRRAVSSWSRTAASPALGPTITHRQSQGNVASILASNKAVALRRQRPNWSVERTCNSRAHFQCALPSHAAHLQR